MRLKHAKFLSYDVHYPIILPHKNWVTKIHTIMSQCKHKSSIVVFTVKALDYCCKRRNIKWEKQCAACKRWKASKLWPYYY